MKKIAIVLLAFLQILFANAQEEFSVTPFSAQAGLVENDWEEYFSIEMNNELVYTALQFDLYLPKGMTLIEKEPMECVKGRFPGVTKKGVFMPNASYTVKAMADVGHYRITIYHEDLEDVIEGNSGELLRFYYLTSEDMKQGLHPIVLKDVMLAVDSKTSTDIAESSSFVTIGSQNDNEILYLEGDVPSFVKDALPTKNVVVEDVCDNLVISDGCGISVTKPFTATSASYSRTMANDWGTICLPYAIESSADIQIYELKSRDENTLVFAEVDALEAGKPGVFRKVSENALVNVNASNVAVVGSPIEGDAAEGLKLVGTYEKVRVDVDSNAPSYYIKDNMFMQGVEYFNVGAFRAYFESDAMAGVKARAFSIAVEDATGVRTVVGTLDKESGEIYSLEGVKVKDTSDKGIYVKRGKKYLVK